MIVFITICISRVQKRDFTKILFMVHDEVILPKILPSKSNYISMKKYKNMNFVIIM